MPTRSILIVLSLWLLARPLRAETNAEIVARLSSKNATERAEAAVLLRKEQPPDPRAMGPLIAAAKRERYHTALAEMLRTLGRSGTMEALGLLQLHAQSPAADLREAGREGLRSWLIVNRVLTPDSELPEPPHRFYGPPGRMSPDRPAGHSLTALMRTPRGLLPAQPSEPAPVYEAPPPGGVPPGQHFECVPNRALVLAGALSLVGAYLIAAIPGVVILARNQESEAGVLLVPVIGPAYAGALVIDDDLAGWLGGLLLLDASAQLAGITMLSVGLGARRLQLMNNSTDDASVTLSPRGVSVRVPF